MKLTHQAAAHASNLVRRQTEGAFDTVFTKYPELAMPSFWELVMKSAASPTHAADVMESLQKFCDEGATYSPTIAANITEAMKLARTTLRTEELKRLNLKKR